MTTLTGDFGSYSDVTRSTTVHGSNTVTVGGTGGTLKVPNLDYGEAQINGGAWIAAAYMGWERVTDGDVIAIRHTSSSSFGTLVTSTFSVDGASKQFSTTTEAEDSVPDVVSLSVSGVEPGTTQTSGLFTLTGFNNTLTNNSVAGTAGTPQASRNGGGYTNSFTFVYPNDQFQLRGVASSNYGEAKTVILKTNNNSQDSATFTITTRAADITPNAFSFTAQGSVAKLTGIESNQVTMAGMDAGQNCPLTFTDKVGGTAFEVSINGAAYQNATGTINIQNGQTLRCKITTPNTDSTTCTMRVVANGVVSALFSVTTTTPDTTPEPFGFEDNANVAVSNIVESNLVTITGITTSIALALSASGGSAQQYSYNGGAWTNIGGGANLPTVVQGDTLKLRLTVPATAGQYGEITVSGGTGPVTDTWRATAAAADSTPDAFSFAPVNGVDPQEVTVCADPITVAGINVYSAGVPISITGGEYRKNGGAWTNAAGTAYPGDSVEVRTASAATLQTTVTATLTIGGVQGTFSVTTRSPDTNAQYVTTFRDSVYGIGY